MFDPFHKFTQALAEIERAQEDLAKTRAALQYKEPIEYLDAAIEEFESLKVQPWELPEE